ncbi:hypothetical protein [Streptomyces sp. MBT62]|uniref:hypothetical protein n=1 Tax=Streptomyces sp. MBT62 TaxID=2800410 RepID=UPI001909062E|nr:hypothetical protein [Streptomyces sp. MBT62]MBK3567814.1 hypothetical protein [Streptomyces sp. MBT62]
MTDDGRGADVITLPMLNLSPPGGAPDDGVPPPPEAGDLAPPPDFFLPFLTPGDDEDPSTVDPDGVAPDMVASASSGTGTPARATASMAMVTMAAIAVAALRGTWSMANYLKARREHHDAVADKAREAADKQKVSNAAKAAKVQSGPEFGRGATGKGGGGRSGGSGSGAGGGSGRGTFGQQQKPSPKSGGRGSSANGSAGAGGRGTAGAGPKGYKNGAAGGGSRTPGSGSSGKGSKGAAGGGTGSSGPGSGSGSGKGSPSGAKRSPGTLGKLATGRQQRKNDEAKAGRQAAADERKADLADRAAARKEAAAEAADRRKRRAQKRKAKRDREKAGATRPKETGKGKPDEKIDLTKKPKAGDGTEAKKDDTEKIDLTKKPKADDGTKDDTEKVDLTKKPKPGGSKKTPKPPRKKKTRTGRRKPKSKGSTTGPRTGRRRKKGRTTSDPGSMPGGDGEWLRPPPGWDVTYTVEDIRAEQRRRQPAGSITTGRRELPAGSSGQVTPTRSVPKESPIVMGTAVAVGEVGDTQFVDAELTVYDLIESDEEMGEQILQGVDHMNLVAAKCEGLKSGLENLYAMCIEKKVPGVLVKWCIRLMERAGSVQDKAEALRDSLPRASEAILAARDTAIEADKLRADRVKEAGHVAPAEREYHDRSGA